MKQWFNWNLYHRFLGDDGFDYRYAMKSIKIPVYSIASITDHVITQQKHAKIF
ncbi:hypothetical protein [Acinetobacter stercoris]|uniref:hypothetical protein n=1 Tax=Acinetobacter stercoris TaxID=2126983 RepID=UPI00148C0C6A|nr:hypothetical protein [Acinetobacter stercoris]